MPTATTGTYAIRVPTDSKTKTRTPMLEHWLRQQDMTEATVADIEQHTLDYCERHGIHGWVSYQNYHREPQDAWDLREYVKTAHFRSWILELDLEIPPLTRNQLLIDVLRG